MTAILTIPGRPIESRRRALWRFAGHLIAATALLVLAPVMVVVALAVLYESGWPVLFRQQRMGQHGRPFAILKFKKFHNAADGVGPHLTSRGDARMTRVGAFLQRTKFDEIPQFINVLRGEMAVIGPRPESLRYAECFNGRYGEVLAYKPGIFGPNQVLFRHEDALFTGQADVEGFYKRILFPLKASVDLAYFARRTLGSDLSLLVSAVGAICGSRARTEHLILRSGLDGRQAATTTLRSLAARLWHPTTPDPALDRTGAAR